MEDFESFPRVTSSILEKWPVLRVIYEVTDGLQAVQKAQELKPDFILVDIGLPTLHGIGAL